MAVIFLQLHQRRIHGISIVRLASEKAVHVGFSAFDLHGEGVLSSCALVLFSIVLRFVFFAHFWLLAQPLWNMAILWSNIVGCANRSVST